MELDREKMKQMGEWYPFKILCADDSLSDLYVIVRYLEEMGYDPVCVEDGEAVLATLNRQKYDILLTDIRMPNMDGFETTKRIREGACGEQNSNLYVVGLTGYDEELCADKAKAAGMDAYFAKPVELDDLAKLIEAYAKTRECA